MVILFWAGTCLLEGLHADAEVRQAQAHVLAQAEAANRSFNAVPQACLMDHSQLLGRHQKCPVQPHRREGWCSGVNRAGTCLLEGLHADAEARQAQAHVLAQARGVKGARVGLHADLRPCRGGVTGSAEVGTQGTQQTLPVTQNLPKNTILLCCQPRLGFLEFLCTCRDHLQDTLCFH